MSHMHMTPYPMGYYANPYMLYPTYHHPNHPAKTNYVDTYQYDFYNRKNAEMAKMRPP